MWVESLYVYFSLEYAINTVPTRTLNFITEFKNHEILITIKSFTGTSSTKEQHGFQSWLTRQVSKFSAYIFEAVQQIRP